MLTLKEIRKSKKITQAKMAELLHIHRVTYANMENGHYYIDDIKRIYIARILQCNPNEINWQW